jgi:hypothetical protein
MARGQADRQIGPVLAYDSRVNSARMPIEIVEIELPNNRATKSMDARIARLSLIVCTVLVCTGATHPTRNFIVRAPSAEIARKVALTAERCRVDLAIKWLGKELPPWKKPCPIQVKVGRIGAGGATRFSFDRGEVFNWNMQVQGSLERILDSVIPHEVNHTILACHFRRPIPRWADEGAATICEHESERNRQLLVLQDILNEKRRIPLQQLLSIKEYPRQMDKVFTLYAEGYSLTDFLVQRRGRKTFLKFLNDAHVHGWEIAIQQNYQHDTVQSLERQWQGWFLAGSPRLDLHEGTLLASNDRDHRATTRPSLSVRAQSPDPVRPRTTGNSRTKSVAGSASSSLYNNRRPRRIFAPEAIGTQNRDRSGSSTSTARTRQPASTTTSSRTSVGNRSRVSNEFTGTYEFQKPVFTKEFLSSLSHIPLWFTANFRPVTSDRAKNSGTLSGLAEPFSLSP